MAQTHSLESHADEQVRRSERRWMAWGLGITLLITGYGLHVARKLANQPVADPGPLNPGPLPEPLKAEIQGMLDAQLANAQLVEVREGGLRDFRIKGTPKATMDKAFKASFRPLVVNELMPRLRPYGHVISFEIANMDFPPARLRPLPRP
ncbi:MAG TPA: hypothetical protein VJ570_04425 [Holophagaceae bacterium]|nr:hypothetical protein [Holophagaceae bacterium]